MKESPGDAISRFRDDVDENVESFSWTVDMVGLTLFSIVAVWMLVSIDGWFTLAVFGPTVVIVYIAAAARRRVKRYREAAREATGRVTEALGETFGAVQAIKVAGAERTMIRHFRRLSDELGLPASRILYVGDSRLADVAGAKNAGMRVAWVRRPAGQTVNRSIEGEPEPLAHEPDYEIETLELLLDILDLR